MSTNYMDFRIRFPEFALIPIPRIKLFISDTISFMGKNEARWSDNYDIAQSYLAAHLLAISINQASGDEGIVAPIIQQEVDDVVLKQAVSPLSERDGEFGATSYGKRYLHYRHISFGATVVGT